MFHEAIQKTKVDWILGTPCGTIIIHSDVMYFRRQFIQHKWWHICRQADTNNF